MNNLISAGLLRIWKDKVFLACLGSMFLCGAMFCIKMTSSAPLNAVFFSFAVFIGIPASIFCSLFTGTEYAHGTIRNKIIAGHSRLTIYISTIIINCAACLMIAFGYILAVLIVGIPLLGGFQLKLYYVIFYLCSASVMLCALVSIYTFICLLISNKSNAIVICLLLSFGLIFLGIRINSRLSVLETAKDISTSFITEQMIYQFLYDLLPTCQGMQISMQSEVLPWWHPIYSAGLIVLSSGIGIFCFKKKDIK